MDRIDVSEEWAATARMELQSAVHVQNAGDEYQMSLYWLSDGSGGQINYRGCRVLFSLGESQGPIPPLIRIFDVFNPVELPGDPIELFNGMQSICVFGVVPIIRPAGDKLSILLDGVSVNLVAEGISGGTIVDAIYRVSMAANAFQQTSHYDFWDEYRKTSTN